MITVYQIVKELGLPHSNLTLSVLGYVVKTRLHFFPVCKVQQKEDGQILYVNAYDAAHKERIRHIILSFITSKRDEYSLIYSRMYTKKRLRIYGFALRRIQD